MKCKNCNAEITFLMALKQLSPFRFKCSTCKAKYNVSTPGMMAIFVGVVGLSFGLAFGLRAVTETPGVMLTIPYLAFIICVWLGLEAWIHKYISRRGTFTRIGIDETPADKAKHSAGALTLLVVDLILAVCACLQLGFVVPVFGDMFRDLCKSLPPATQIILKLSSLIMAFHGVGFVLLTCLVLFGIIHMYLRFHRRGERKRLFTCLWVILVGLIVLVGIMTVIMSLPIFDIECITG
jgi:heme A synthase